MSDFREIERIRKDANAFRALAWRMRSHADLSDWERDFVQDIPRRSNVIEFTVRQAEKLLQIRDDHQVIATWRGFSIATLIERCHAARLDLSEDDEDWIATVRAAGAGAFKRRSVGRLARIAAQLGIIERQDAA